MARRAAALALVFLLLMALSQPVSADSTIYFTAVNDMVLELSDLTMPFWSNGLLYVPCSVLSGTGTGINYSNNTSQRVIVLYTRQSNLVIDINAGTIQDGSGNVFSQRPIYRNNVTFVPLVTLVSFFDLTYTNSSVSITTDDGVIRAYLIRIKSGNAQLSDSMFITAAAATLSIRYNDYIVKKNNSQSSAPSATTPAAPSTTTPDTSDTAPDTPTTPSTTTPSAPSTATPSTPSTTTPSTPSAVTPSTPSAPVTPEDTEPDTPEEEEIEEPPPAVTMYLSFAVRQLSSALEIMEYLEPSGQRATFYFAPDVLDDPDSGDLLRQLTVSGYSIGFLVAVDDGWLQALSEANDRLFQETGSKTRLLRAVGGTREQYQEAELAGWKLLENYLSGDLPSQTAALSILTQGESAGDGSVLWLDGGISVSALRLFFETALEHEDTFRALTELV